MNIKEFIKAADSTKELTELKEDCKPVIVTQEMILEFENEMRKLKNSNDYEDRHIAMDGLMCRTLSSLGFDAGVEIFYSTDKWYS